MSGMWIGGRDTFSPVTWSGMHTFTASPTSLTLTGVPTGTTATTSTLVVNPPSASANADLAWMGIAGAAKWRVDEDGDVTQAGFLLSTGSVTLSFDSTYGRISTGLDNGLLLTGSSPTTPTEHRVLMGLGALTQNDVVANINQFGLTLKRDIDLTAGGGGPYNEDGAPLRIWRDVTNGGVISGDFAIWTNDGTTALGRINTAGGIDAPASTFGDLGVTNYAAFAADGTLTLNGTARVIRTLAIANANLGKGGTAPSQVIVGNYNVWEYGVNDDTVFTFHIPHDYAAGTDIEIQIDWQIDEAGGDEIKWQIAWAATPHDSSEPIDGPTHTGGSDTGDIVVPATVRFLTQNTLTIGGASLSEGDQVGVTLSRIAITGGTPPANEPGIVDIHIEYTADSLGE